MIPRIYHRWEKWECYRAGFFSPNAPKGMTAEDCEKAYAEFLSDEKKFMLYAYRVVDEWLFSCEHNLSNPNMNRIAWIGQSAMCLATGVPSRFRSGYHLLTKEKQIAADLVALKAINYWMFMHGYGAYTLDTIRSRTEANLY